MKFRNEHCSHNGKYIYCSEEKARRALERYDDIKRVYECPECKGWHTTSIDSKTAVRRGIIKKPKGKGQGVSVKQIQDALKKLQSKC